MNDLSNHPYRVLVVEDEERDWATPMCRALRDTAKAAGMKELKVEVAHDQRSVEHHLARSHFHLISLDMRLPARTGEVISVGTGVKLARFFPYVGFPKYLVYSLTLHNEDIRQHSVDAVSVLQIPVDHYAKSIGGDHDAEVTGVEVLRVPEWAQLVVESLCKDQKSFKPKAGSVEGHERLTVAGAYLHFGPSLLPPVLARHIQELHKHWETEDEQRIDAAIRFIEATVRLALAQTAVLLTTSGSKPEDLPADDSMATCLRLLQGWQPEVAQWNWTNYLSKDALNAFSEGLKAPNEEHHKFTRGDPVKAWAGLREPLQYAMDVAAYWVRHPLCVDLRYSRDGWNAELLAGTAEPRPRRPLPAAMDFPRAAANGGVWQSVWRIIDQENPERVALSWGDWLVPDPGSERPWWLPMYLNREGRRGWLDLSSGEEKPR